MGKLYYDAIAVNDVPIILGNTYIFSIIFVVTIFITDIAYGFFDPKGESRIAYLPDGLEHIDHSIRQYVLP